MANLTDTPPEVEQLQVELFQRASVAKHIGLLRSLSQTTIELSRRAIRKTGSSMNEIEIRLSFIALHYDPELARQMRESLRTEDLEGAMNKPDILTALIPVVETFEELGVPYYIGGSVASSAYGLPRATVDVDLVTDLRPVHIQPFIEHLQAEYYVDEKRVRDAVQRRVSFNLIHFNTLLKVDVFISKARPYDQEVFRRVLPSKLEEAEDARDFYLASPEDVILAKLEWYRAGGEVSEHQWKDLLGVLKVKGTNLDIDYLKQWSAQLGLSDLLKRALAEADL
jgi:hypothetical protein